MKSIERDDNTDKLPASCSGSIPVGADESVFCEIFNNNLASMLLVDPEGEQKFIKINESACQFYGYNRKQFLKLNMGDIAILSLEERQRLMKEAISKPHSNFNFVHKTSSGLLKDVEVTASPVTIKNKRVIFIIVHDVTEQKAKESELKILLDQTKADTETKGILLREINHRVKNNLSSLIGILYAEKKKSKNTLEDKQLDLLDNLINRVKGMSIAHDLLSRSGWKPISMELLSKKIIHSLKHFVPSDRSVQTEINKSSVTLDADQSQSMAVIINELFVNSLEHASAAGEKLKINIKILEKEGSIYYKYMDNGPGFSEEVLTSELYNVGLYLIKNIVEQGLRGKISLKNKNGALVEIQFPGGEKIAEIQEYKK